MSKIRFQKAEKESWRAATVLRGKQPRGDHPDGDMAVRAGRDGTPQGAWMLCQQVPHAKLLLNENQMRPQLRALHEDEQGENQQAWGALHLLGLHL